MRTRITTAAVGLMIAGVALGGAQLPPTQPDQSKSPAPPAGASGNAANVQYLKGNTPGGGKDKKGNPVRLATASGHVSNYDEAKVPPFALPDPLVTFSGRPVTSAEQWFRERRPEVLKYYQTEIYGRIPDNASKVTWEVTSTEPGARNGTAVMRRVVGRMGDRPDRPRINLTVYTPANVTGPVPMLLNITFGGGATAGRGAGAGKAADPAKGKAPAAGQRRGPGGFDPMTEVLQRGWGYATVGYGDIQPDAANRWTEGVVGLTLKPGQTRPAPDEWGTISAWAWGVSRCIDFFETDKSVNPKRIAITGTSRLGKTVLWAGAQDERVAAVFSVVSGEMGAALIRRDWGETLDDMAQNFAWQFADNLQKYVGRWNDLLVDQHLLIALSAPRPVYVNGGLTDQWSDPRGEGLAIIAAGPVYRLLGGKDLGVTDVPPLDKPVTSGDLAFHYHSGGHQAVPADWTAFLDFADRHYKAAGK